MSLPVVPLDSNNEKQHRTVIATATNQLIKVRPPNDRTAAEVAAGVTPLDYGYAPVDLRRLGGNPDGTTDSTTAVSNASLVSATAGGGNIIVDGGAYRVASNTTIAAAATLEFKSGSKITVDSGVTLTINGTVRAPLQTIFAGLGTVVFGTNSRQTEVHPEWWGAATSGTASTNRAAIQAAMDAFRTVAFANGTYTVDATLYLNDDNTLKFASRASILAANITAAVIAGKNPTTERRFNCQIWSGTVDNTARSNANGIALDFLSVSMAKVFGTLLKNVATGIRNGGASSLGAFYNEFHGVDILTVVTGYNNGTLGNDNKVFGGRVNDCTTGTIDNDNSGNSYFGVAIEVFTTGHSVSPSSASLLTRLIASRLENLPTSGTGVLVGANAQDTLIESAYLLGLTTDINDGGLRTTILMPRGGATTPLLKFGGGQGIFGYFHADVTHDVASLAAGAFRQEGPITVAGARVGDAVSVALPAAWPNNIMVGVPIVTATDTLFLPMYNPSGGAVDPASGSFSFDVWRH